MQSFITNNHTALKPAAEHWILIRKPLSEKTIVDNVLKWGTGGINIDVSRIYVNSQDPNHRKIQNKTPAAAGNNSECFGGYNKYLPNQKSQISSQGRFPANVTFDEHAARMLDEQSGELKSGKPSGNRNTEGGYMGKFGSIPVTGIGDSGGASRFFYCAKASKKERGEDNNHPTVKAQALMKYLIEMITPPNGIVLDPFMGSGSTGVAVLETGFRFKGIELEKDYFKIARMRIGVKAISKEPKTKKKRLIKR